MLIDLIVIILIFSIPLIALLLLRYIVETFIEWIKGESIRKADINKIDKMSGREFEIFLKYLFEKQGYKVKLLRGYKDHGADLILIDSKGNKIAVQAKKRNNGKIGIEAIGEVLRGQKYYSCTSSMIVTNQYFTEQAKQESQKFGIILCDRKDLLRYFKKTNINNRQL